jgi:hypothetical protein
MKRLFICYRRNDSFSFSRRLAQVLRNELGKENVFFDEDSAPAGTVWPQRVREALHAADALIVVIGDNWLRTQDEDSGKRRIDLADDWVRQEILNFSDRMKEVQDLVILPVLIHGAAMALANHLDPQFETFCIHQPIEIPDTGQVVDFVPLKLRLSQLGFQSIIPPAVVTPILGSTPTKLSVDSEKTLQTLANYRKRKARCSR